MLLAFKDGQTFATGSIAYWYRPTTEDRTPRIIIQGQLSGILTHAVIDTGAPYIICSPQVTSQLALHPDDALDRIAMTIRGIRVQGHLYRIDMVLPAVEGDDLTLEVTAFMLDADWASSWGDLPSFVGLNGCLERVRFAIDPEDDTFYFGPL